ncbi:MAG: S1C family serine protease [Chitinophagales bacterium]
MSETESAYIELSAADQALVDNNQKPMIDNFVSYCISLGFEDIAFTTKQKTALKAKVSNPCDIMTISVFNTFENSFYTHHRITFRNCRGEEVFRFNQTPISADPNLYQNLMAVWKEMHSQSPNYNIVSRLVSNKEMLTTEIKKASQSKVQNDLDYLNRKHPVGTEETVSNRFHLSSSGSAVAIHEDGYIITNYHVIEGQDLIELMIPQRNPYFAYRAVVVDVDKEADLALLKIEDQNFSRFPSIPYYFRESNGEVGEEVFALGYPLTESMGYDIKLGDGLISSRSGYKGDVNTHQISVPVHSGYSGAPLFDSQGSLVGIIKAKHSKAESVSYAIKTSNIQKLIRKANVNITLPNSTSLQGKDMTKQVKDLESFVFLVRAFKEN